MIEVEARDGRARSAAWTEGGATLRSPAPLRSPGLIVPETSFAPIPPWAQAVVTQKPSGRPGRIEIVSGGTWFHPSEAAAGIVVPPVPTAPTAKVQVVPVGEELAVFHDAGGWASDPKALVPALVQARTEATPARLLWAPALGTPADYAVWAYLGVDLFDASPLLLAAARGQALAPDGPLSAADAARIHGPPGDATPWDGSRLAAFNLEQARAEMERVRLAIAQGTLRALAERRAYGSPRTVEILRRFDREHHYLEAAAPRHRAAPLAAMTAESLWGPEVEAFRRAFRAGYVPPRTARVLVLLPCSQRKPYKTSRSHRAMARVLDDSGIRHLLHEVMVTSPLGLVPRELEEVYPAQRYDVPVTGHWMKDEEEVVRAQLSALLAKHPYGHVVVHTGPGTCAAVADLLPPGFVQTCQRHPTDREDLARLAAALSEIKARLKDGAAGAQGAAGAGHAGRSRKLEDLRALASFQFGPEAAAALCDGGHAAGHLPYVKLFGPGGAQMGTTTADRGVLSLTLDGAAGLARLGRKRVFIEDFQPRKTSSLFAVGVEGADPDVRPGDEVVVVHRRPGGADAVEVRGCGVAQMAAEEMTHARRGVAVVLRHTGAPAPAVPLTPAPAQEVAA